MKNLLIATLITLLFGCGYNRNRHYVITEPPKNCSVTKQGDTVTMLCPDGTVTTITDGADGTDGTNGHSVAFDISVADYDLCANGGSVINFGNDLNDDLSLQLSEVSQTAILCNGLDGSDGQDGSDAPPTQFTPVEIVDPCGDAPNKYDEVFLRLANGTLLASVSDHKNGNNTRFSIIGAGTWQTTDGDECIFTLNNNGYITYESHNY